MNGVEQNPRAYVLIVDDDKSMRETLRIGLERVGLEVNTATNGKEALELIGERTPDIAVVDILMPDINGSQVIKQLKADKPDIKIIAITGGGNVAPDRYLFLARELGADRSLAKPFRLDEIRETITELLPDGP